MAAPVVIAPIITKLAAMLGAGATTAGTTAAATAGTAAASKLAGTASTKAGSLASKIFTGMNPNAGLVDMFPKLGKGLGKKITPTNVNAMADNNFMANVYNNLGNVMGSPVDLGNAMQTTAKGIQGANIKTVQTALNNPALKNMAFQGAGNFIAKQNQEEQPLDNPYSFQGGGFSTSPANTINTNVGDIPLIGSLMDPLAIKMKSKQKGNEMQAIDKTQLSSSTSNPFGSFKDGGKSTCSCGGKGCFKCGGKAYKSGGFSMESSMVDEINEMAIKKMLKRKK